MFLEVAIFAALGHEAVGGKDDDEPGGKLFHLLDHFPSILLGEVLNHIERHAGIEPAVAEQGPDFSDIRQAVFVVGPVLAGLFQGGGVAIHADELSAVDEAHGGDVPAANIKDGVASRQG